MSFVPLGPASDFADSRSFSIVDFIFGSCCCSEISLTSLTLHIASAGVACFGIDDRNSNPLCPSTYPQILARMVLQRRRGLLSESNIEIVQKDWNAQIEPAETI
jgi:hypothetical protein